MCDKSLVRLDTGNCLDNKNSKMADKFITKQNMLESKMADQHILRF